MKVSIVRVALVGLALVSCVKANVQAQQPWKRESADSQHLIPAGVVRSDSGVLGHLYLVSAVEGEVRSDMGVLGTVRLIHDTNEHMVESDLGIAGWLIIDPLPDKKN